ncbi:hypothetical protein BBF93_04750 [Hyphomonas sp. CACIAM 19H1]|uniref:XRE family transcriptional regulator n=1 Tax=Hyphomonas sp. CACIAM 19H1 TaxID=1873716 RepID=UPI000DF03409|nr:XRE family transcriptional regulator [Hyphomonas sp. CACIAM 19H1]AXE63605.1 hypothetical protein BBF93_04750 [Hyphomonas sp. CACIAM 19H1]
MAKPPKALVEPDILVWARTSASMSIGEAAAAAKVKPEALGAWEAGTAAPSVPQLKKLANVYKRPLSVMFLTERPKEFMPLKDFRLLTDIGPAIVGPKLAFEIRAAQERRQIALELYDDLGEEAPSLGISASVGDSPEEVAAAIRGRLGVSVEAQMQWRDTGRAFRAWRDAVENAGVLVFALSGAHHKIPLTEVRGFAIAQRPLPVAVVNSRDRGGGRIFTLLHELAHIVIGESALDNSFEVGDRLPPTERAIERFCNKVAGAVLLPRDVIMSDGIVRRKSAEADDWTDEEISELAARYSVSRPAILVRLQQIGKASGVLVSRMLLRMERQYKEDQEDQISGMVPWRLQVVTHLGRSYSRLVLQGYYERKLSLNSAAAYLGTQSKLVPDIAQAAFT